MKTLGLPTYAILIFSLFAANALLWPGSAAAQDEPGDEDEFADELDNEFELLQEDEIVYTAAKHGQDIAESPSAITVITKEQIRNTHCTDLACLLRQVPELEVRRVLPMYHAIGARAIAGELSDKGLVFIDGLEFNMDLFGVPFWAGLPVHLDDIERIEVIRGPGSALYGANAHSMVVSITTRKADQDRGEAFIGYGEINRGSLNLRVDQAYGEDGQWQLHLAGGLETADHWRIQDKIERDLYRVNLRLEHIQESSSSALMLGLVQANGVFYTEVALADVTPVIMSYALLQHNRDWLKAQVSFALTSVNFEIDLPLVYHGIVMGHVPDMLVYLSTTLNSEIQFNWSPFDGNLLIGGLNYRWISHSSDNNAPEHLHQHSIGLFVQDEQRLFDQLFLSGAVRIDYNSLTPYTISPRLAVVWRFSPSQLVRLAAGRAFRKPSGMNSWIHFDGVEGTGAFPELGDFFRENIGNSEVGNESVTTIEAGYRNRFFDGDLTTEINTFFSMYRDTISFYIDIQTNALGAPDLSKSRLLFSNGGREVDSMGGSISMVYRVRQSLRLSFNYTYRYSWYIADPIGEISADEGGAGSRINWEPAHLANFGCHYFFDNGLRLGAAAFLRSAYQQGVQKNGNLFEGTILFNIPLLVNIGAFAAWRLDFGQSWIEAGLRVFNILNQGFRDTVSVTRANGTEVGGELVSNRFFFFVRGGI
ncbi:MAG: TonB-dependent receptor [Deltaproteobacteria bacterium]|nr:TonB-dependent receptor [Deltaproteobacteria bacterium]